MIMGPDASRRITTAACTVADQVDRSVELCLLLCKPSVLVSSSLFCRMLLSLSPSIG